MSALDWVVLFGTLGAIVGYGLWKTRARVDMAGYLHGGYRDDWRTIGLSVMATQASAITFLSTPGQAYEDGMRFVQFYFGLPLAMIALSVAFVPRFYRLRVFTAYEYLESRFDLKTRQLAAILFLLQRGLSAGITIYAPAIILSKVLGWSLNGTCLVIGALVVLYTVAGGTRAVSQTQKQQMVVMLGGMAVAAVVIVLRLPPNLTFGRAVRLAGVFGKMNVVDFSVSPGNRYTFWSGLTGGFFLAMAYFGTDQSQVQRYLSGRSITESRLGLLFNGLFKVPMQALILFVGVLVFVFYQFNPSPLFFNESEVARVYATPHAGELRALETEHREILRAQAHRDRRARVVPRRGRARRDRRRRGARAGHGRRGRRRADARRPAARRVRPARRDQGRRLRLHHVRRQQLAARAHRPLARRHPVRRHVLDGERAVGARPVHPRRLLQAALAPRPDRRPLPARGPAVHGGGGRARRRVRAGRVAARQPHPGRQHPRLPLLRDDLGIFLLAFFARRVRATPVFVAALVSEAVVIAVWLGTSIGFLWFNVLGCAAVVGLALALDAATPPTSAPAATRSAGPEISKI